MKTRSHAGQDLRKSSRFSTNLDCRMDFEGVSYSAIVTDISLKGVNLSSRFVPPTGASVIIAIPSQYLERPLVLEGKVKRSSRDLWDLGIGGRFGVEVNSPPLDLIVLISKLVSKKSS